MTNVKSFRDGSRLILVVENCTGELATKVNNFLVDILGTADTTPIPDIIPAKPVVEKPPVVEQATEITRETAEAFEAPVPEATAKSIQVEGVSGTLGRALDTGDTAAVIDACMKAKNMDESVRATAMRLCKNYLYKDCMSRDPDITPTEEIKKFFSLYMPLIGYEVKQILEMAAFAELDDFFLLTDEYIHQDAYRSVLDKVIERVKE